MAVCGLGAHGEDRMPSRPVEPAVCLRALGPSEAASSLEDILELLPSAPQDLAQKVLKYL